MGYREEYLRLMTEFPPEPIRNEAEHKRALKHIEAVMKPAHAPSKANATYVELLAILIEQYEERTDPTPPPNPVAMLEHCLEARGLTATQVAKETGISKSVLSNVLARRRGISKINVMKLAKYFGVAAEEFIQAPSPAATV